MTERYEQKRHFETLAIRRLQADQEFLVSKTISEQEVTLKGANVTAAISYSWGSVEYENKVEQLATQLRHNGVESILDKWEVGLGSSFISYMDRITNYDYILIICTPEYKKKASILNKSDKATGVYYEFDLMKKYCLEQGISNKDRFIPILLDGSKEDSIPLWLYDSFYVDLTNHSDWNNKVLELSRQLLGKRPSAPAVHNRGENLLALNGRIYSEHFSDENLGILTLANGSPIFSIPKDIATLHKGDCFFITCPEKYINKISTLDANIKFNTPESFGRRDYLDIAEHTGIANLPERIHEASSKVSETWINVLKSNKTLFNGRKIGIKKCRFSRRADEQENTTVELNLFTTDYFTHRTMREVYRQLVNERHDISDINSENFEEKLLQYYPFLTSLGVNTFLLTLNNGSYQIIFVKRSKKAMGQPLFDTKGNSNSRWHVSMNEGWTDTDFDSNSYRLWKCLVRGFEEELGLKQEMFVMGDSYYEFLDFFFVKDAFEIGLASHAVIHDITESELNFRFQGAKDRHLESVELKSIGFNDLEINSFISKYEDAITPAALHTLRSVMRRFR